jgi:glycosyltransferase involved in cell wall biosynthesis
VIGYAGRLVEEKGIHLLLQALAGLNGPWKLRLIGSGPYAAELKGLSSQLGISERVLFELWTSSAEMPAWLNQLDVLVLPSLTRRNWKEQFGRVLIEAMACEVPVVGSSSGEIPHLIGDAGMVFPEGDVTALREALSRLMNDDRLCAALGRRGRNRVLELYTQQRVASRTYDIYREVLGAG